MDIGDIIGPIVGVLFVLLVVLSIVSRIAGIWRWLSPAQSRSTIVASQGRNAPANPALERKPGQVLCQQSGWKIRPNGSNEIVNQFGYRGVLAGGVEQRVLVVCGLEPGIEIKALLGGGELKPGGPLEPHIFLLFSPPLPVADGAISGVISSDVSPKTTGVIALQTGTAQDGATLVSFTGLMPSLNMLGLLRSGEDATIQLFASPSDPILKLHLPIGPGFEPCYREAEKRLGK